MGKKSTRDKVLDAAEILFAEKGFDGTSVRAITEKAGVNLAALNYHFGSKSGLIEALFKRRIDPINKRRLEMLREFEAEAGISPVSLEKILEAFLAPALRVSGRNTSGSLFVRLMGRIHMEGNSLDSGAGGMSETRKKIMLNFKEIFLVFRNLLERALPDVDPEELLWRMSFNLGAMAHAMLMVHGKQPNPIAEAINSSGSPVQLTSENEDKVLKFLIRYTTAGSMAASD